jgi:hypothetical protein
MYASPDRIGQLARDHHDQMLTAARQRQLRPAPGRPAPRLPALARRLAAAFAKAGAPAGAPATQVPARLAR